MKKLLKIGILISILSSFALAQERGNGNFPGGSISGKVLDSSTKHTIEYANVVVFSQKDSSMITGGVTDVNGLFNLKIQRPGQFYIEIRFIGYDTEILETTINRKNLNISLGEIFIHPSSVLLENVVVEGERAPVTYQIDKKVINPDQMQTVISGNASDVLANVPSVQVDIEGNVSLRGSQSFTVLIDGRPSILDAQDALQQVAASSIDKIEIITNPSAKYDPEGTAGIINIILKKNLSSGWNGIVNANAGMHDSYGGNFLVNYQSNGIKTNLGFDYNRRFYPGDRTQNNIYFLDNNTSTINSIGKINRGRVRYEGRGGIEFSLTGNDVLSFGARVGYRDGQREANQNYSQFSDQEPEAFNYLGRSDRSRSGTYYSLNANYAHNFGVKNHQILGELFFSNRNSDEATVTAEFDEGNQFSGRQTKEFGPSTDFRGKLDYTLPFSEFSKFESGYQGQVDLNEETNELFEFNPANGEYEFQQEFSNLNKYTRSEHALYSIYSDKIWEIQIQGGLRAEYTYRTIEVPTQNETFNIDRIDYFPSVHSSYKLSDLTTLMASYSRRIERPRGWALEPFPTWIDANNVRFGNPNLQPEFIDSYETGIQTSLGEFSVSSEFYYRITKNKIEFIRTVVDENVTQTTFENVGKDYSLGAEVMFNFNPLQFWNVNLMGNVYNYLVEGVLYGEPFSRTSFNWQTRFNNSFKLWSTTQIQFNLNYNSPSVSSQGRWEGSLRSDLSVRHEIIENVLAATLQIRDVFGTTKREFTSQGENFYNYNQYDFESPTVMLNFRYTFNNYKPKREGRNGGNGDFDGGEDF
ncbi:MAG: TonB-dependent receptor [Ignavibacteriaceae bacterium]|nr:TonB-dependent receptor [Ignavibacteriaceae bacterium]